jgi:hypothetical protein
MIVMTKVFEYHDGTLEIPSLLALLLVVAMMMIIIGKYGD